jgi:hypothetical protein
MKNHRKSKNIRKEAQARDQERETQGKSLQKRN